MSVTITQPTPPRWLAECPTCGASTLTTHARAQKWADKHQDKEGLCKMSDIENRMSETLAKHMPRIVYYNADEGHIACNGCEETWASFTGFHPHQAAMLAPLITEAQAVALEEAADELNPRGEKPGAYSNWLRARATQLRSSDE